LDQFLSGAIQRIALSGTPPGSIRIAAQGYLNRPIAAIGSLAIPITV
jgi:hypothetical protein